MTGHDRKGFVKNLFWMLVFNASPQVFGLLVIMLAARLVPVEGMNDYQVALGLATMLMLFADLGFTAVAVRRIAEHHENLEKYYSPFIAIRGALNVILYALSAVVAVLVYGWALLPMVLVVGLGQLLYHLGIPYICFFQGLERMKYIGYGALIRGVVYAASAAVLTSLYGVWGLAASTVLCSLASYAAYLWWFRSLRPKFHFDLRYYRDFVSESAPFMLIQVAEYVIMYADKFILSLFAYAQVVFYSLPLTLAMCMNFATVSLMGVAFPYISKRYSLDMRLVYEKVYLYLSAFVAPACVGMYMLAPGIIDLVYGSKYTGTVTVAVLQVLSGMLFFYAMSIVSATILQARHQESNVLHSQLAIVASNVLLNFLLAPLYGALGCAVACLVSIGLVGFVANTWQCRHHLKGMNVLNIIESVGGSCLAMAVALYLLPIDNVIVAVGVGALVYGMAFLSMSPALDDLETIAGKGATP